jgi:LacI family transcriptional regulator
VKPAAVFTANGALAVEAQELCEQAALAVPGEIAIVGVEDYLLSVGGGGRSISGVDTNLEEQGYQGAALLDRLMRGEPAPGGPMRIAPARVVTRKSSDILAVSHRGVARGLRFISEHFSEGIGVDDVARAADMSRRGLHQAFVETLGRTPGEEIRGTRIDFARNLLAETDQKIESVARQSGYPNINTFFIAFRKAARSTPAEFRTIARRGR